MIPFSVVAIASIAIAGGILLAHARPAKVPRASTWFGGRTGVIVVAPSFPREYVEPLHKAVAEWSREVEPVSISMAPVSADSLYEDAVKQHAVRGVAVFDLADRDLAEDEEHLGRTWLRLDEGKRIISSVTRVPSGMDAETARKILRHEIGHVLGYEHTKRSGHWMSALVLGDDHSGL